MIKNNKLILFTTLLLTTLTMAMTCAQYRNQSLQNTLLKKHPFLSNLTYQDASTSVTGQSLILYNVSHPDYPTLTARRLQLSDNATHFKMIVSNFRGSLISFFQQTDPYAFKYQVLSYSVMKDLFRLPLITLTVCGYDALNADISIIAEKLAPNQISVELIFKNNGKIQAHFASKFTPKHSYKTMGEYLHNQDITLQPIYLNEVLTQCFLDYSNSKNQAPLTSKSTIPLSLNHQGNQK